MQTVKSLKKGDFFTKKPIENPEEKQVFIRGDYIKSEKRYECIRFNDSCDFCYLPGNKVVFTDFVF